MFFDYMILEVSLINLCTTHSLWTYRSMKLLDWELLKVYGNLLHQIVG